MKKLLVINSAKDLSKLHRRSNVYSPDVTVLIAIPEFSNEQNSLLTSGYNKWIQSCGCVEGAATGIISMIAFLIMKFITHEMEATWIFSAKSIGVLIGGMCAGKVVVLMFERIRIQRLYNSVITKYKNVWL